MFEFLLSEVLILVIHDCALRSFSKKIVSHLVTIFFIGSQDLAVRGVSKFKVGVNFITFREFNIMLKIVDSIGL